jgi:hypothetical protein
MQSPTQSFRVQRGFNEQRAEIDARKKKSKHCRKSHMKNQCVFVEMSCKIHGRALQKHLLQIILSTAISEQIQKNRLCLAGIRHVSVAITKKSWEIWEIHWYWPSSDELIMDGDMWTCPRRSKYSKWKMKQEFGEGISTQEHIAKGNIYSIWSQTSIQSLSVYHGSQYSKTISANTSVLGVLTRATNCCNSLQQTACILIKKQNVWFS